MDTPIHALRKNPNLVIALVMVDTTGASVSSPVRLQSGANKFRCIARYVDGSEQVFPAFWTCPQLLKNGGVLLWSVFGHQRQAEIAVHAGPNHERYLEVACWTFDPESAGDYNPHFGITFDYTAIDSL